MYYNNFFSHVLWLNIEIYIAMEQLISTNRTVKLNGKIK